MVVLYMWVKIVILIESEAPLACVLDCGEMPGVRVDTLFTNYNTTSHSARHVVASALSPRQEGSIWWDTKGSETNKDHENILPYRQH